MATAPAIIRGGLLHKIRLKTVFPCLGRQQNAPEDKFAAFLNVIRLALSDFMGYELHYILLTAKLLRLAPDADV